MPGPRKESLKVRAIWVDRRRVACETGGTFRSKSCQIPIRAAVTAMNYVIIISTHPVRV